MMRVGFIINSRVPEVAALRRGMPLHALWTGWDDRASPMGLMRFRWIANALKECDRADYRLFRPGLAVDAVVFLKSMGGHCMQLAETLREQGIPVVFEANVDYYTEFSGNVPMTDMAPTATQRQDAIRITAFSDQVIASSRVLADVCRNYQPRSAWIPDNVDLRLVPRLTRIAPVREGRLQLWWSGVASKAFELLVAGGALRKLRDRVHLHLVTDDLERATEKWSAEVRAEFREFLSEIPHTVHRFGDIAHLLRLYAGGGVIISPRTLDVPYNLSHTEWKITLGMACGLPAVASPVPSYLDVREAASEGAVTLCDSEAGWVAAFDQFLSNPRFLKACGDAAFGVVSERYSTEVVAQMHADVVEAVLLEGIA